MNCRSVLACTVVSVALLSGCGGRNEPKLAEVSGKVTQAGNPVAGAIVTFYPDALQSTKGPTSTGTTDDGGEFVLSCGAKKGAVIGHHKVTVVCPQMRSGMGPKSSVANSCNLPKKLGAVDTTPLKAEVSAKGEPLTFEVPAK